MDSMFHFVFPLIVALAAKVHLKHGLEWVIGLSLATVLMDLDVFMVHRATLHNLFVVVLIPVIFFLIALKYEKRGSKYKTLSLVLLLFLFSHTLLDMGTEAGVQLFYPLSSEVYQFNWGISVGLPPGQGYLISGLGISLLMYFFVLLLVLFVEDFVKYLAKDKSVEKAFNETMIKEKRRIRKEL
jgi:membrane-bound metal-dependent hydrolase YbcI (DUF457 family)